MQIPKKVIIKSTDSLELKKVKGILNALIDFCKETPNVQSISKHHIKLYLPPTKKKLSKASKNIKTKIFGNSKKEVSLENFGGEH